MYCPSHVLMLLLGALLVTVSLACNDYLVSGPDGSGPGGITNDQISASTFLHAGLEPWKARLNSTVESYVQYFGGWIPAISDNNQFIQAEFDGECEIRAISTLGRFNLSTWVEEYTVSYSVDGSSWETVNDSVGPKLFAGNTNKSEVEVQNILDVPFHAKYVRLQPTQWKHNISLRFDLIGCCSSPGIPVGAPTDCNDALVTESYGVSNAQITASSFLEYPIATISYDPWAGRLEAKSENCNTYWIPDADNATKYIQVDFRRETNVHCIMTKGEQVHYVASYIVHYSMDGSAWHTVLDVFGNVKLFAGNDGSGDSVTTRCLPQPAVARYVRLELVTSNKAMILKFDVIGCNATADVQDTTENFYEGQYCLNYLTSGDDPVWDESFTASSFLTMFATEPWMARLTAKFGWASASLAADEYIQVDLHFKHIVRAIVTGGCVDAYHVRTFYVGYGDDGANFEFITHIGSTEKKLFPGNDGKGNVDDYVMFPEAVFARYIRVYPHTYCTRKCMRFDVLGCSNDTNAHIENVTCSYAGSQCDTYLLSDIPLPDDSFSASSTAGSFLEPWNSRYNSSYGWCASDDDYNKYIQVDLQTEHIVTCILTRSVGNSDTTRSYYIQYYDGSDWVDTQQLIPGNYNDDVPVKRSLPVPLYARYFRLLPHTGKACLRFDILGCRNHSEAVLPGNKSVCQYDGTVCHTPLLQFVMDANITASSAKDGFGPEMGRLSSVSSWTSVNTSDQYIQVDFETHVNITCITTTGNGLDNSHVRSYYVAYSSDGVNWTPSLDSHGQMKLFPANDQSSHEDNVTRHLPTSLYTTSIRIIPVTYSGNMSLRFDIIGCGLPEATTTGMPTTTTQQPTTTTEQETTTSTTQPITTTIPALTTTTTLSSTTSTTQPTTTTLSSTTSTTQPTTTTIPTTSTTTPTTTTTSSTTSTTQPLTTTTMPALTTTTTLSSTTSTTQPTTTTIPTTSTTQPTTTTTSSTTSTTSTTQPLTTTTIPALMTTTTSTTQPTTTTIPTTSTTQPTTTTMSITSEPSTTPMTSTTTIPTMTTTTTTQPSTASTTQPPTTTTLNPMTSQYYVIPNNTASCVCTCTLVSNISLAIDSPALALRLDQLISATKVAKNQTKVAIMKKISAPDDRQSAYAMGGLGASLFAVTVGLFVLFDVSNIFCRK